MLMQNWLIHWKNVQGEEAMLTLHFSSNQQSKKVIVYYVGFWHLYGSLWQWRVKINPVFKPKTFKSNLCTLLSSRCFPPKAPGSGCLLQKQTRSSITKHRPISLLFGLSVQFITKKCILDD